MIQLSSVYNDAVSQLRLWMFLLAMRSVSFCLFFPDCPCSRMAYRVIFTWERSWNNFSYLKSVKVICLLPLRCNRTGRLNQFQFSCFLVYRLQ